MERLGKPNVYVTVRWATFLSWKSRWQIRPLKIFVSIKIENAAFPMSQIQKTEPVLLPRSRSTCNWSEKFAFSTNEEDVLLFELIDCGGSLSKTNGTVIGQARLLPGRPLALYARTLGGNVVLDIYEPSGLEPQAKLMIELGRYVPPSTPVLTSLPSPYLLSQALPLGWEERRNDSGRIYYIDHNKGTTSWTRPVGTINSSLPPGDAIAPALPDPLRKPYVGITGASREAIVPAFPDPPRSQGEGTSLNKPRSNSTQSTESKTTDLIRCPNCSQSFEDPANLTYHLQKVHSNEARPKSQNFDSYSARSLKLFRCRYCHEAFEDATNRVYHIKRNHLIQCPTCSQLFEGSEDLAYHMGQSHPVGPKYYVYMNKNHHAGLIQCRECANRFESSENLAWHVKHAHLIIMLRKCPQCPISFGTRFELEKHFKERHPGGDVKEISESQSPYHTCIKCDKAFSCQESLSTHEKEKHGSGHFTVHTSRSNSQQIEESGQASHFEKITETSNELAGHIDKDLTLENERYSTMAEIDMQEGLVGPHVPSETSHPPFITKDELEEYDLALAIRLQEEEEEEEKVCALREKDEEDEEGHMHGSGSVEQAFGVPRMYTQEGNISRVEKVESVSQAHTSADLLFEASLIQEVQKENAVSGLLSSDMHSVLPEQNNSASNALKEGPGSQASSSTDSSRLGGAFADARPTPPTAVTNSTANEPTNPPVNTSAAVKPGKESSGSVTMRAPTRIAANETIPPANNRQSVARYTNSPEVTNTPATELQATAMNSLSPTSTLSNNTLNDRLSAFFLNRPNPETGYSDAEIMKVSRLLKHFASGWSKVPRTYIILRTIGCLHVLQDLLAIGFSDHWFPVSDRVLPQLESLTPAIRSAIEANQDLILTKSIDLEKGGLGKHHHFATREILPFETLGVLGKGKFGQVDRVLSIISYKEYAIKYVPRLKFFGNVSAAEIQAYLREVGILKRLKHRHIVEFRGSYTDPQYFAIVMSPVAEMDLAKYLSIARPKDNPTLRTYFGCLTTALQYLHDNEIRHKDIKPQNILVHRGKVLLTDFGLSRDSTGVGSTTSGSTGLTPRYCAPEVAMQDSRNTSSDIWSLGCVFLEMFVVLKGHNVEWMKDYFHNHGTRGTFVSTNPDATAEMISELEKVGSASDNRVVEWVQKMLKVDRNARPKVTTVIALITSPDKYGEISSEFCGLCCADGDDSSGARDRMDKELFEGIES